MNEERADIAEAPESVDRPAREPPASRGFIAESTFTIVLLLFASTTLVQAFVIPTGSMEDTLMIGDHVLVDKLAYAPAGSISGHLLPYSEIKRGDIVVFRYPVDISQTFVKRAIGLPGDRIHLENKRLILNGKPVTEPYVYHKTGYIDTYRDNFPNDPSVPVSEGAHDMLANHLVDGEVVVPPGCYFAMGDNRDSSLDSRYWGFVPRENIIGKPLVVYWSYDASTEDLTATGIGMRHMLDVLVHFPTKTRWKRAFNLVHGYPLN